MTDRKELIAKLKKEIQDEDDKGNNSCREMPRYPCSDTCPCALRDKVIEITDALEAATAELQKLRDILQAIEMFTATGEGLGSEETIEVHIIAAEGRSDDPCAWRADPHCVSR